MKTINEETKNRIKYKTTIEEIEKIEKILSCLKNALIKEPKLVHRFFLQSHLERLHSHLEFANDNFINEYDSSDFIEKIVDVAKEIMECQHEA